MNKLTCPCCGTDLIVEVITVSRAMAYEKDGKLAYSLEDLEAAKVDTGENIKLKCNNCIFMIDSYGLYLPEDITPSQSDRADQLNDIHSELLELRTDRN